MRHPTTTGAALVALVLSVGALTACSGEDYASGSAEVRPTGETEARAGSVTVSIPAGAATGGELDVEEGPEPDVVPDGVLAVGPTATVSLDDGTLDAAMTVSFDPPKSLASEQVPIVMAKAGDDWEWLPTSWEGGASPVTAQLAEPGEVFLARFDRTPWLEDLTDELAAKANNPAKVDPPTCGDETTPVEQGLQVGSESGDPVLWCAGIDTVESAGDITANDVDYAAEGVQATVLRVRNNSRMFNEVGFPSGWLAVDGSGMALDGQVLRERLGLAGTTRDGLTTRVLAPGDTLALLLPDGATGTVTADLSAAAWTLSALDFASSSFTRLVSGVDAELGDAVRGSREELLASLTTPTTERVEEPTTAEPDPEDELAKLRECLAPVAEVILVDQDVARRLTSQATQCTPSLLRPVLSEEYGAGAAEMADGVATSVLEGLPSKLELAEEPWQEVSDAATDPQAGYNIWVGEPPAQELDYADAPLVFHPGDAVDVPEWSPELTAYVEERLALLQGGDDPTVCPEGSFTVVRYSTDGFALAEEVSCDGEEHRLVLGLQGDGWQELDAIQQDPLFGCDVMGTYEVPAFIAGDTCLDGETTQEYTG